MLFRALVAMVLVAPLPFGAVPAWAWSAMAGVTGALLLGWGSAVARRRTPAVRAPRRLWWAAAPFGLAVLWAGFQTVPFSPSELHHPLWRSAAEALGSSYRGSISLDPVASRESLVRIVTSAGIFWLALQLGRDRGRAGRILVAVAAGSAVYAAYGLAVDLSGANTILWLDKTAYHDVVTATFVNRNSFATFAGLGLLCTVAALYRGVARDVAGARGARESARRLLGTSPIRHAALAGAALVLGTALALSESRAGAAATGLGFAVLVFVLAARRGLSARAVVLSAVLLAAAGAAVMALSGEGLERRLHETESDWRTRAEIAERTRHAIGDAPILGTGLGTFASVYRVYRSGRLGPNVDRAHNDYLELALELGLPAAACFVGALAVLALVCAAGVFIRRRDVEVPAVGLASCVLVGAHALVDFSLQIPAVAATFALVLGAAVAQSWRSDRVERAAAHDTPPGAASARRRYAPATAHRGRPAP